MTQSESIKNICAALIAFRRTVEKPHKNAENPHFKSGFADINEINDVILEPMCANGLAYTQAHAASENGVTVETLLMHSSGEWLKGSLFIPTAKHDPQVFGSASTYGRRYSLEAMLGLRAVDDDAETAQGRGRDYQLKDRQITQHEETRERAARAAAPQQTHEDRPESTGTYAAGDPPYGESEGAQSQGDWREFEIPFGKLRGKKLGTLEAKSLDWWIANYEVKPFRGSVKQSDSDFRAALNAARDERKQKQKPHDEELEDDPPF